MVAGTLVCGKAAFRPLNSPSLVFLASTSCAGSCGICTSLKLWHLSCTEDKVTPTLRATPFYFSIVYLPIFLVHFPLNDQGETPARPLVHRKA